MNGYLWGKVKGSEWRGLGLSYAVTQDTVGSNSHCPYGRKLWDSLSSTTRAITSENVPSDMCALRRFRPRGYKTFSCSTQLSMKFCPAKNLIFLTITNSFLLNMAEHENFSASKYENAKFLYMLAEKISCSAELSMKKSFITSGTD